VPLVGIGGIAVALVVYFIPGVIGAWLAVFVVNRIKQRIWEVDRRGVGGG
jgi:hypothetical protein